MVTNVPIGNINKRLKSKSDCSTNYSDFDVKKIVKRIDEYYDINEENKDKKPNNEKIMSKIITKSNIIDKFCHGSDINSLSLYRAKEYCIDCLNDKTASPTVTLKRLKALLKQIEIVQEIDDREREKESLHNLECERISVRLNENLPEYKEKILDYLKNNILSKLRYTYIDARKEEYKAALKKLSTLYNNICLHSSKALADIKRECDGNNINFNYMKDIYVNLVIDGYKVYSKEDFLLAEKKYIKDIIAKYFGEYKDKILKYKKCIFSDYKKSSDELEARANKEMCLLLYRNILCVSKILDEAIGLTETQIKKLKDALVYQVLTGTEIEIYSYLRAIKIEKEISYHEDNSSMKI